MATSPISLLFSPPLELKQDRPASASGLVFDASVLRRQSKIPKEFIWPQTDRPKTLEKLNAPIVDLGGFLCGDENSTKLAVELVGAACRNHGFFQVVNHGVEATLVQDAMAHLDAFFKLPLNQKMKARRKSGSMWGYTGAHTDRFSSKLPWKETLSLEFQDTINQSGVMDYFTSTLGEDFKQAGLVYQRYCETMKRLTLMIMELLGRSLGVERGEYRDFFEDGSSLLRCNYYPQCQEPDLALGTGPHCDPTSLTVLAQEQVGGLEVFADGQWRAVPPVRDAFVINIGDTFTALSNGRYKSCLHRAVVNRHRERKSLAFFLSPRDDRVIRPPAGIGGRRKYPDFTWSELKEFTQKHYRADMETLQSFSHWLESKSQA